MKMIYGIWAILSLASCFAVAQRKYEAEPITQTVQYDDDDDVLSSTRNNSPYPQRTEPKLSSYEQHHEPVKSQYYRSEPVTSRYVQPEYQHPESPYSYYTYPKRSYDSSESKQSHEEDSAYNPIAQSLHRKPEKEGVEVTEYKKLHSRPKPIQYEQPEELQYSQEAEEPSHHSVTDVSSSPYSAPVAPSAAYPAPSTPYNSPVASSARYPAPKPHDPKLPLYFTMYEKRIIQDPTDRYGKGPWRYLTYGHGITYGSKEPGKVFEKGYGYIRALGRDHCKLPENLCPPRDEKPFEYEGRKEPYFGYRPH